MCFWTECGDLIGSELLYIPYTHRTYERSDLFTHDRCYLSQWRQRSQVFKKEKLLQFRDVYMEIIRKRFIFVIKPVKERKFKDFTESDPEFAVGGNANPRRGG